MGQTSGEIFFFLIGLAFAQGNFSSRSVENLGWTVGEEIFVDRANRLVCSLVGVSSGF